MSRSYAPFVFLLTTIFLLAAVTAPPHEKNNKDMLIYVADPMCSWCYGFAPEIALIKKTFEGSLDFRLVMGGLRPGGTETMTPKFKKFLEHHWVTIHKRTGQPFRHDILDDTTFVYDTEPAARAVVTARLLASEKALPFFEAIQHAFYAENKNTTKTETFVAIANDLGMDTTTYRTRFESDPLRHETAADFLFSRELGVTGFPTLLVKKGDTYHTITVGYDKHEKLIRKINKVLKKK